MIGLSIRNIPQRTRRGRRRVDSRRRDSNHSHIEILGKVNNWVNKEEVCINKTFHLIVEIN
jgi:hypothetical protein